MSAYASGYGQPAINLLGEGVDGLPEVLAADNTTGPRNISFDSGQIAVWPDLDNTEVGRCALFPTFWGITNDFSDIVMGNAADDSIFHNFFNGRRVVFGNIADDPLTSVGEQQIDFILNPLFGCLFGDGSSSLARLSDTNMFLSPPLSGSYTHHSMFFNVAADGIAITQDNKYFGWGAGGLSGAPDAQSEFDGTNLLFDFLAPGTGIQVNGPVGFNSTAPVAQPTIAGSRGGNAALADLLINLAATGILIDGTGP